MLQQLNDGKDGGPPNYAKSGASVAKAANWALRNALKSCGRDSSACSMSVFSAISPWAEAILHWTASRQRPPRNARITSVDFNPCVLVDVPSAAIAECVSTLELVNRPETAFDLIVSYSGIEHDGLGRYGDPINPDGDISAMREMWLSTRAGGVLLVRLLLSARYVSLELELLNLTSI